MFQDKLTRYFDEPGPQNTNSVIEAVKGRVRELKIGYVVVASESGKTALKVAEALKDFNVKVVCVTAYAGVRRTYGKPWPEITGELRKHLEKLGVKILEETPWICGCTFDTAFLGAQTPSKIIHTFLSRALGYGFKTALECALLAADAGAIPTDEEVVSIAGTGWAGGGADCAIVAKSAHVYGGEFISLDRGLEVKEVIAMPRLKFTERMIEDIKQAKQPL
ncbi:MAG: Pyruvate kinase, alpha/beta domain [Candidatus Bathyarchaeota archaeon BA1]|nr:MAG: Pyruvate kinase, alpha/beta domain [Candidatus Bathyarchaeota archaeon BA1]